MPNAKTDVPEWAKSVFESENYTPDKFQMQALLHLDRLRLALINAVSEKKSFFKRKKPQSQISGAYIYGPVGRGKTYVMDVLAQNLEDRVAIKRVHFHEFMISVHDFLHAHRKKETGKAGADTSLLAFAEQLSRDVRLLCFDEFHVTNVADAMILSRLFTALFAEGISVILTSNWEPDNLYEGGLQRVRFLPFIDLIKSRCIVIPMLGDEDYRKRALENKERYFLASKTSKKALTKIFGELTGNASPQPLQIVVKGRAQIYPHFSKAVLRVSFDTLFDQPLGAEDYLALANQAHTVLLEGIPALDDSLRNEVKRFMTFVDVMYDQKRTLIIEAEKPALSLYSGTEYAFEFERTVSRLLQMQDKNWPDNKES